MTKVLWALTALLLAAAGVLVVAALDVSGHPVHLPHIELTHGAQVAPAPTVTITETPGAPETGAQAAAECRLQEDEVQHAAATGDTMTDARNDSQYTVQRMAVYDDCMQAKGFRP